MAGVEPKGPQFAVVDIALIGDPNLGALDLRVALAVAAFINGDSRRGQAAMEPIAALERFHAERNR